ncbi:MAG: hypothetical protein IKH26_05185 [Bacteroidaceae bacterium]|nr:hypothetical protein [Bacteroidaceae bacterium]
MKKTYLVPETIVSEMEIKRSVLDIVDMSNNSEGGEGQEDTNKRNNQVGRDVTWGNLW